MSLIFYKHPPQYFAQFAKHFATFELLRHDGFLFADAAHELNAIAFRPNAHHLSAQFSNEFGSLQQCGNNKYQKYVLSLRPAEHRDAPLRNEPRLRRRRSEFECKRNRLGRNDC